jgi:hypothetical protein
MQLFSLLVQATIFPDKCQCQGMNGERFHNESLLNYGQGEGKIKDFAILSHFHPKSTTFYP